MPSLTTRVEQAIETQALLADGDCVVVAVSGGLDSMVLMRVLQDLAGRRSWRLIAAHFDHGLRGKASAGDARFVGRAARALDIEFVQGRGDAGKFARDHGISLEMGGRVLRHRFLAGAAKEVKASAVALAHHADDQVELFFLRLFRGAGVEGLSGMDWKGVSPEDQGVRLIRPLLGERRVALAECARARGLAFREDASNRDLDILRNRIRHELLPLLRRRYQPGLDAVVARTMAAFRDVASLVGEGVAAGRGEPFAVLPVALQRQILSIRLRELKVPVTFDLVERLRLVEGERVSAGRELFLSRDKSGAIVETMTEEVDPPGEEKQVSLGMRQGRCVFGGVKLKWRHVALRSGVFPGRGGEGAVEVFDADKVGPVIVLRHWRYGDRFQPSGLGRPARLQNLFVNQRISRETRRRLVIAATSAGTIFWVEGLRISEGFKLDKTSRWGLKWAWERTEIPMKGLVAPPAGSW